MADFTQRSRLIWGDAIDRIAQAHVMVVGLGGVGCAAVEALTRAGVGRITAVDMDRYELSNLNRQLFATRDTLGKNKAEVARERVLSINPDCRVEAVVSRVTAESIPALLATDPHVVLDAIDTITFKLALIEHCSRAGVSIVSCLGTGNRSDPTRITAGDIADTAGSGCPVARVLRRELKKRGVDALDVVYSTEQPLAGVVAADSPEGRHSPGSTPFVPNAAGLAMAHRALQYIV